MIAASKDCLAPTLPTATSSPRAGLGDRTGDPPGPRSRSRRNCPSAAVPMPVPLQAIAPAGRGWRPARRAAVSDPRFPAPRLGRRVRLVSVVRARDPRRWRGPPATAFGDPMQAGGLIAFGTFEFLPYLTRRAASSAFVNAEIVGVTAPIRGKLSGALPGKGLFIEDDTAITPVEAGAGSAPARRLRAAVRGRGRPDPAGAAASPGDRGDGSPPARPRTPPPPCPR